MNRRLRSIVAGTLAGTACALAAPGAHGDGLPVPFDGGDNAGVTVPESAYRYSTVGTGRETTVVKTAIGTGEIQRTAGLEGDWGVPLVAYDGSPSGLSADGRTLVLIEPRLRFPRSSTTLAVFDAERLELRRELTLDGDFSFDALSPDGRLMYLIHYPEPRDPTAYEVRAYDLDRDKLLAAPIVDPNESGEEMAGFPQTRAASPDGRWAYTLYAPAERDHPPFVHALDTGRGTAVCIDLDLLASFRRVDRLALEPSADGATLAVADRGEPVAEIDLGSFAVAEPATAAPATDEGGIPWPAVAIAAAVGALGLAIGLRRRLAARQCEPAL